MFCPPLQNVTENEFFMPTSDPGLRTAAPVALD